MNASPETPTEEAVRPPRLIQCLLNGFNTVATHIYLILLPLAVDLLLWFGPHLRVKTLLAPSLAEFLSLMQSNASTDMQTTIKSMGELWQSFIEQYNLVSAISTFPVGIPSLFSGLMPVKNPLGAPMQFEISSMGQFILGFLVLTLMGLLIGSLYFGLIARVTGRTMSALEGRTDATAGQPLDLGLLGWQTLQVLALIAIVLVILMVVMVPALIISLLTAILSPFISQIVLLLVSFGMIWLLVPLIFSPHGIFLYGLNAPAAMSSSARMVRFILPSTGLFLLAEIIINQGLGMLWSIPPATSWMALVGIFGHAFIVTGLLAASFVFYRSGLNYLQALQNQQQVNRQ